MKTDSRLLKRFNSIFYWVFIFLLIGCNEPKNGRTGAPTRHRPIRPSQISRETIDRTTQKGDSIFTVNGLRFKMNGDNVYWEYQVEKLITPNDKKLNVVIISQKLRQEDDGNVLFETANEVDNVAYQPLEDIKNNGQFNLECSDLNGDGYCDYKIVTERAAAGANTTYGIYLYSPKNKKFEYSKIFSVPNMEYDKEKNRISSMWKLGARQYCYDYQNLKKNKRDVAFSERVDQFQDTVVYSKFVGKKLIEKKRVVLDRGQFQGDEVSEADFSYLLERDR